MKTPMRILMVLMLALAVMVAAPVSAQDATDSDMELEGSITHVFTGGSFDIAEDGTITVTLASPVDFAPVFYANATTFYTLNMTLFDIQADWEFVESDLVGEAVLDAGDAAVVLYVTNPILVLDTGEISYTVAGFGDEVELDKNGLPAIPSMDAGSMTIALDGEFINAFMTARTDRLARLRDVYSGDPNPSGRGG